MKRNLSLILSVILLLSLFSCADMETDEEKPTGPYSTATTAPAVTDNPHALIAHLIHPCEIPDGYVYPEGTAQFYIDNGLWLKEDFYRPDIIWTTSTLVTMDIPRAGTVRYNYGDPLSYSDTKYAFTVSLYQNTTIEMEESLAIYLTGLGFELMDTRNPVGQLVFAGTGRSIEALDCTALQNAIGCPTEYGIDIRFEYQELHSHTEPAPEGKFWSCGYPSATAQYYIDNGFNLPADFTRPDLIWDVAPYHDSGYAFKSGEVESTIIFVDDPSAKYAVQVRATADFDQWTALTDYLISEGWEHTDLGTDTAPIFAATKAQIAAIDFETLQQTVDGITKDTGISLFLARHEKSGTIERFPAA